MTVTAPDVAPNDLSTPSVLALVVVGDGSVGSLRECLLSLAHQSYPRVGVLAVDDATTDGSSDLLQQALGPRRVLRNDRPLGLAGSVREALSRPVARRADFVLLVDPEATLDPDSVGRLVEAAMALGVLRFAFLALGRRFDEAYDLAAAWGWNASHLPGTFSRRRRAQKSRRVSDRSLHRFMASAGLRLPRWFATAERILEEQRAIDEAVEGEPIRRKLRDRTASLVGSHPVIVASFVALIVGAVATRELVSTPSLVGGALPAFPPSPGRFFSELAAAARSTPPGGSLAPSPALGALGALATVLFGDPALAQKALLLLGPPLAATLLYRAAVRSGARPGPAVVAAASYGLSAFVLWAFSEGRIGTLLGAAILP